MIVAADYTLVIESQQNINDLISSIKEAQQAVVVANLPPGIGKLVVNTDPTIIANTETTTTSILSTTSVINATYLTTTISPTNSTTQDANAKSSTDYTTVIIVTSVLVGVIGIIAVISFCFA